jgi:anti-anti-sigma factor
MVAVRQPINAFWPTSARFNTGSFVLARFSLKPREHENGADIAASGAAKQGSWALDEQREAAATGAASSSGSTCEVTERRVGEVAVVAPSGVVDMLTAPQLEAAIRAAVDTKPTGLIVDLTAVEFLASAGMGVIVAAHDEVGSLTTFGVVAEGPATSRPLKLVGIADIVPLYATLDEALAALKS